MKKLNQFITEKFRLSKDNLTYQHQYNYYPKTRDELIKIIDELIKERGKNADLNDIDTSEISDMHYMFVHPQNYLYYQNNR